MAQAMAKRDDAAGHHLLLGSRALAPPWAGSRARFSAGPSGRSLDPLEPVELDEDEASITTRAIVGLLYRPAHGLDSCLPCAGGDEAARHRRRRLHRLDRRQQLLAGGHEVVVLDNLERGHREAVPPEARLVVADLLDAEARRTACWRRDSTACCTSPRWRWWASRSSHPERYYRTNVGGTLNLLEAMRAAGGRPARVLLDLRRLRAARGGADPRDRAAAAGQRLRRVEAGGRPDDRRLLHARTGSAPSACGTSTSPARAAGRARTTTPRPT